MANRQPDYNKEHTAHYRRIERYVLLLEQIYGKVSNEAVRAALMCGHSGEVPFSFSDYPQTKAQIDALFSEMAKEVQEIVVQGANLEWVESNTKNDQLARYALGIGAAEGIEEVREKFGKYFNNHQSALSAFVKRKEKGLGLSDKVWRLTDQYKADLELSLSVGISEDKSAAEISRDVRKYLQDPDKLFRRVREKFRDKGSRLILSKNAKAYHPGNGSYRSSYKNAMRLTRTEVNMAYRKADHLRWQDMDFVVGFEVCRSRKEFDCSVCSALKGKYPKDFVFVGWHPQCRCYVVPILKTPEELLSEDRSTSSVNEVEDVSQGMKDFLEENGDRIQRASERGTLPYWVRDNKSILDIVKRENDIEMLIKNAKGSGVEIDGISNAISSKYGGYCTPINFKSRESIIRKMKSDHLDVSDIKDAVRTTIIVPANKIDSVLLDLQKVDGFVRLKRQTPDMFMGYSGNIANLKTSTNIIGEIQVNTEMMIYAKERKKDAIRILGSEKWNAIRKMAGVEGGLGHVYYEKWRILDRDAIEAKNIEKKSIEYYSHFR